MLTSLEETGIGRKTFSARVIPGLFKLSKTLVFEGVVVPVSLVV